MARNRSGKVRSNPTVSSNGNSSTYSYNIGALEQRIYGVEKGLGTFSEQINDLLKGLDDRIDRLSDVILKQAKPQYQALAVALTAIGMIGTIVYLLIQIQIAKNSEDISENGTAIVRVAEVLREEFVPRVELNDWREELRNDNIKDREVIYYLRDNQVPRSELEQHWDGNDREINDVRDRVERIEQNFTTAYSLGDVIQSMEKRMESLESMLITGIRDNNGRSHTTPNR